MNLRMLFHLIAGCLILGSLGCSGRGSGAVTGKVTVDGQPLPGGKISFVLKEKPESPPLTGQIQADGTFTVPDVPYGELLVAVIPPPAAPSGAGAAAKAKERMAAYQQRDGKQAPPEITAPRAANPPPMTDLVPLPCQDPLTTDLVFLHDAANAQFNHDFK